MLLSLYYSFNSKPLHYEFRRGPVPYVHKGMWCGINLRYPSTFQANREAEAEPNYTRGKRRHLPTAYDDQFSDYQKNWKSYGRKVHQWDRMRRGVGKHKKIASVMEVDNVI